MPLNITTIQMKHFYLIILFIPFFGNSQITLSNSDFADGGDITAMSTAIDPTIDYTTTGANQIWDFSNLIPTGQTVRDYQLLSGASFLVQFVFFSILILILLFQFPNLLFYLFFPNLVVF